MGRFLFFILGVVALIYLSMTLIFTTGIDDSSIKTLFKDMETAHNQLLSDPQSLALFLAEHLSPDFTVTNNMLVHTEGHESKRNSTTKNKDEYMQYLLGTSVYLTEYAYKTNVENIIVDDQDKRKALVQYHLVVRVAGRDIPEMRTDSECEAKLIMLPNGILQILNTDCTGQIYIKSSFE